MKNKTRGPQKTQRFQQGDFLGRVCIILYDTLGSQLNKSAQVHVVNQREASTTLG